MDRAETRFKSKKVTNLNTNWELNKIGTFSFYTLQQFIMIIGGIIFRG